MVILGSGSIVSQLAQEGLIDEYEVVVNPIVLGEGRTMFDGVKEKLNLKRTKTRAFGNGNVFLCYEPTREGSTIAMLRGKELAERIGRLCWPCGTRRSCRSP